MAKIVIIGGGLTGLSAAYHLEQRGFSDYILFEKDDQPGGLCRSVHQDNFTFDYTGHLLHTSIDYFKDFIVNLVGLENLNTIQRRSFIYSNSIFTRYPFQIHLAGLPSPVIIECIEGFVNRKKTKHAKTFPEWVHQQFGKGFAKHFFLPFQRKIFAHDLHEITASWTGRFVPSTTLRQLLEGALNNTYHEPVGYNAHFYYPKQGGIQFLVEALTRKIKNPIRCSYAVKNIDLRAKIVRCSNGHEEPFDSLITTMPLNTLLHSITDASSTSFNKQYPGLVCNSVINFNIGVNHAQLSDKHWVYFPEKQFPFYRIGFPHNFSTTMAPDGCSSLYGELSFINKSPSFIRTITQQALKQAKKLFSIQEQDILTEKIIPISHAYVIFNTWRDKYVPRLLNRLAEHNIFSVGRYGEWKYSSMQEAVMDGKKIAETITILPAKILAFSKTHSKESRNEKHKTTQA